MATPGKRLKILGAKEKEEIYGIPRFGQADRIEHFALTKELENELSNLRSLKSKAMFVLQLGYFKSRRMIFVFGFDDIREDADFVMRNVFRSRESLSGELSKPTRLGHQKKVLEMFQYRLCNEADRTRLLEKACAIAPIGTNPTFIFKELVLFLERERIVLPGYSVLQNIIGKALAREIRRLEGNLSRMLTDGEIGRLASLLKAEDTLHQLTLLKREPKDFSFKEMAQEKDRLKSLKHAYEKSSEVIPQLGLSNENIKYYASLVGYYTVYKLKRLKPETAHLYLLCFVYLRYQKINDHLIDAFIHYVNQYSNEAKLAGKTSLLELKTEGSSYLRKASKIIDMFTDDQVPDEMEFGEVRNLAFTHVKRESLVNVSRFMAKTAFDTEEFEWEHIAKIAPKFKKNLRPLFTSLVFDSKVEDDALIEALEFLKRNIERHKTLNQLSTGQFPKRVISSSARKYLMQTEQVVKQGKRKRMKTISGDKYEFHLYHLLRQSLDSGDIHVNESMNFKSFDEDLVDDKTLARKDEIIRELNVPALETPMDELLSMLEHDLESRIQSVNQRITKGENSDIKLTKVGDEVRWKLPYNNPKEPVNNPLFGSVRQVSMGQLLCFANEKTGFLEEFTHILGRYAKSNADDQRIFGGLVGLGTNNGLNRISESSGFSFGELSSTVDSFFRSETLKEANDRISNATAKLPIFKHYSLEEDLIHSSSDGQKFGTQIDTFNSRYSPKYFGMSKGISNCSVIANNVPINARVIGANDHESHFIYDLLQNNTSEIIPDRHSTDSHGINHVNFIILYLFGYFFAPRFKNLSKKAQTLYGFQSPKAYDGLILRPLKKVNVQLIKEEIQNIEKIILSLALKSSTQSTIVRKLSSYKRQNRTKKALWELDNIIRTLYILEYIDSRELRINVQRALNRGEAYNRLRKAIFYANFGKFRVRTQLEQHLWSECTRLIANSIIFYNSFVLSQLLERMESSARISEAEMIKLVSPIAWQHINLYGSYEFPSGSSIDIDQVMSDLELKQVWNHAIAN